eukprot:gene4311-6108_t
MNNDCQISEDDLFQAMLGFKDLNFQQESQLDNQHQSSNKFYREEFCGACGTIHLNPSLLDIYPACKACQSVLREPSKLRSIISKTKQEVPLDVIIAAYGDMRDPVLAVDVTSRVQQLVNESFLKDRLCIRPFHKANEIFGCDPSPGRNKQLRVRYRMNDICATLVLEFTANGTTPSPFLLISPSSRYLRIINAIYGHPKGSSSTGRMSFDVTEYVQSLVDLQGGSYLSISRYVSLERIFNDPCPGYTKDLRIQFEVCGRSGCVVYSEVRGFLRKKLSICQSPTVAPLIIVVQAVYGITPTSRLAMLDHLKRQIAKAIILELKHREGSRLTPNELILMNSKVKLIHQQEMFRTLPTNFIDVRSKIQAIADAGGTSLVIDKDLFDANQVLGNPSPGNQKILTLRLECNGHDAEKLTETNEMTDTGYNRNFITIKNARYNIIVEDDPVTGRSILSESVHFRTDTAAPIIVVTRATYGELKDTTKIIDVTSDLQNLVVGSSLVIETD